MFCDIVDSSGFVVGGVAGVVITCVFGVFFGWMACMDYSDFALGDLTVAFEDGDLFGVGGDCAAFEEDE